MKFILTFPERIVSASLDKTIKIWDINSFECIETLIGHTREVYAVAFIPSKQNIVSGGHSYSVIKVWNSTSFKCIANLTGNSKSIFALTILPDNENI